MNYPRKISLQSGWSLERCACVISIRGFHELLSAVRTTKARFQRIFAVGSMQKSLHRQSLHELFEASPFRSVSCILCSLPFSVALCFGGSLVSVGLTPRWAMLVSCLGCLRASGGSLFRLAFCFGRSPGCVGLPRLLVPVPCVSFSSAFLCLGCARVFLLRLPWACGALFLCRSRSFAGPSLVGRVLALAPRFAWPLAGLVPRLSPLPLLL